MVGLGSLTPRSREAVSSRGKATEAKKEDLEGAFAPSTWQAGAPGQDDVYQKEEASVIFQHGNETEMPGRESHEFRGHHTELLTLDLRSHSVATWQESLGRILNTGRRRTKKGP